MCTGLYYMCIGLVCMCVDLFVSVHISVACAYGICTCVFMYVYTYLCHKVCIHVCIYISMSKSVYSRMYIHTGWRRLIESPKLQIIFHKRATKYRSLLRKMTYKDKGSYESSPPCIYVTKCVFMYVYTYLCHKVHTLIYCLGAL